MSTDAVADAPPPRGRAARALHRLAGIDARSLAALRIGLGTVLFADLALRARDLAAHYSDRGVLPRQELLEMARAREVPLSLHLASGSVAYQGVVFAVAALAALALVVGYRSRLAAFVSWLLLLSLHARNPVILSGGDNLLRLLLFWSLFVPLGAAWSLDRRWSRRDGEPEADTGPILSVGTFAVLAQVTLVYWTTAALKWHPRWIEEGTAVFHALHLDQLTTRFGQRLLAYPELLRWSTYGTMVFEIVGPLLAWSPLWTARLRVAVVALFVGFHLFGLGLALELGIFPWVCVVAWLPFLPGRFWDAVAASRHGRALRDRVAPTAAGLAAVPAVDRVVGRLRRGHPGTPPRRRPRFVVEAIAAALLLYVVVWNLRTVDFPRYERFLPTAANPLGFTLRIDQHWNLFAPYPARDDGWYVMPGRLAGGDEVDVFTGEPPTFEKPELISATWGGQRWRKYMMNLWERENAAHRRTYGAWVCRRWNTRHTGEERLEQFRMIFLLEPSPDPGEPVPEPRRIPLWTQVCVDPG